MAYDKGEEKEVTQMNELFGNRLRMLRTQNRKNQEQMAKLLKIQRTTYGEYERGKISPPMEKVQILANYFDVSVDYLMGNTNLIKPEEGRETEDINDVSVIIRRMIDDLEDDQHAIVFEGEEIDKPTREILISSLKNSIQTGQLLKKVRDDHK